MYSSSSYFHDGCTSDYLSSFQTDCLTSNLNFLDASVSLYEGSEKQKCLPERDYCSPTDVISSSVCSSRPEFCPSRDAGPLLTKPDPSSGCGSSVGDWFLNSRREAKRARVENIIKGMSSTTGLSESMLGNKEVQALPEGCRSDRDSSVTSQRDACTDLHGEFDHSACVTHDGWKRLLSATRAKSDRIELMTDVLKCELSRAIGRSIDSIFKSAPPLQTPPPDQGSLQAPVCSRGRQSRHAEDVQTEALSLVVPRAAQETTPDFSLQCGTRDAGPPLSESSLKKKAHQSAQGRPKVSSRSLRSLLVDPPPRPLIKMESDATANNYLYRLNEGLTTNHLKKAKLMFFYTRYPSSQVLKACFHDVQLTRCVTSQLIKWFSNFREFYYIQMEKSARQAVAQGVTDVRSLAVERESGLFRALNTHYNKANDFQVPQRFLEVAAITLREFYSAISTGEDRDPSWKKAIYKVICKLDGDVPAEFKHQHSG